MITAYYDEHGYCHTIDVRLNAAGLSREDVAEAVRAVFQPSALPVPRTVAQAQRPYEHRELGSTDVIPAAHTSNPAVTVTNMHPRR